MATRYHAEHVGSLLRTPELLEAREGHRRGEVSDARLREATARAALAAIDVQRQAGIEVFTDGEVRRSTWMAGLLEALDGLAVVPAPTTQWYRAGGDPDPEETHFDMMAAVGRLSQKRMHTAEEAAFLDQHAPGQYKITMMSSSMATMLWHPELSADVYADPAAVVHDVMNLQIKEIEQLLDQGVTWVQLDSLSYNLVFDPSFRERIRLDFMTGEEILAATVAVDAQVAAAAKRKNPDVTIGMHICRGNNRSAWMSEGGYEPVAEHLFNEVGVDRFLLEYDTERAGGFEPLRFMPPGKTVVLGLISSKLPRLESQDDLLRRIEEAAKYVPAENLALSPQCGFASTERGNLLTVDDERRKLELVATTAQRAWG